jgi:hypothetical protein
MHFRILFFVLFTIIFTVNSLAQVKVGQWLDHLSYNSANSVAKLNNSIYFSNGSGLAKYNTDDNSIEKLTKIEGLSDVGVKLLRKVDANNRLLVIYDNTNIDVIKSDGSIVNLSDIKRKTITGKKYINEVFCSGGLAYLACGFGIIVFDTDKIEIKNTYYLGSATINLEVYQVTKNDTALFAATSTGIYYGKLTDNLSYFQNWKSLNTGIAAGPYNTIVNFGGKILANYSNVLKTGSNLKRDTIYQFDGNSWVKYPYKAFPYDCKKLYSYNAYNKLLISDQWGVSDVSNTGVGTRYITYYGFGFANINDVFIQNDGNFWLADLNYGLIKSQGNYPSYSNELIAINGPDINLANDIDIKDGKLVVAPVNLGPTFDSQYSKAKPNFYSDYDWKSYQNVFADSIRDPNAVSIDPNDKNHIAFACMSSGIVDMRNDKVSAIYQYGNTPLVGIDGGSDVRVSGISFDKNSNLWASLTFGKYCVSVRKTNNTWVLLNFEQFVVQPTVSKIIFDKHDQAWIVLPRNVGLMVYKDVNGLSQPNASNTKFLTTAIGNGKLPNTDIQSICEDNDGHIWVGTGKGVIVFYNPENVFTGSNWDCQQILIEQDGHVQILLENDIITSIAVDGVNRKWIGTESSGVYCFSPDGQKQIYHFTQSDSPLYSNLIRDIVCDETTGDIFIASDIGIQSFRTSIIKGYDEFTGVHAYPNPVKPGYVGSVYIKGLIDEADVKITDVYGNLVWSAKSQGGQLEWNLETFSGKKASTGVYLIYCASASGDKSSTTKLMIVN